MPSDRSHLTNNVRRKDTHGSELGLYLNPAQYDIIYIPVSPTRTHSLTAPCGSLLRRSNPCYMYPHSRIRSNADTLCNPTKFVSSRLPRHVPAGLLCIAIIFAATIISGYLSMVRTGHGVSTYPGTLCGLIGLRHPRSNQIRFAPSRKVKCLKALSLVKQGTLLRPEYALRHLVFDLHCKCSHL